MLFCLGALNPCGEFITGLFLILEILIQPLQNLSEFKNGNLLKTRNIIIKSVITVACLKVNQKYVNKATIRNNSHLCTVTYK